MIDLIEPPTRAEYALAIKAAQVWKNKNFGANTDCNENPCPARAIAIKRHEALLLTKPDDAWTQSITSLTIDIFMYFADRMWPELPYGAQVHNFSTIGKTEMIKRLRALKKGAAK